MNPLDSLAFRKKRITNHARIVHHLEKPQYLSNPSFLKDQNLDLSFLQSLYHSIGLDYSIHISTLTSKQSHKLISKIFSEFYIACVFLQVDKRDLIFYHLLELESYFEKTDNYPLFLLMILMYYLSTENNFSIAKRIIQFLQSIHRQEGQFYTFDDLIFLQYSALYEHQTLHNESALEKLLLVKKHAQDKNMLAMNEYYLTMVYLTLGEFSLAKNSNVQSAYLFLSTSNLIRCLYSDINKACLMSATGAFQEAQAIYGNCLIGARNMDLFDLADGIMQCIACSAFYAGQYENSIHLLNLVYNTRYAKETHYLYAFNYFYLGKPHLALKWLEEGKMIAEKSQTACLYLELISLFLLSNDRNKIIRQLKKMELLEHQDRHYGSHYFIQQLLNRFENTKE